MYEIDAYWISRRNEEHRVSTEGIKYIGIDEIMVRRSDVKVLVKVPLPVKGRGNRKAMRNMKRRRRFERKWVWVVRPAFATIIYDLQTGRILAIAEGRSSRVASRLLHPLGKDVLANVEAVCIDMAACYKKSVRGCLPKAAIVFDCFHVKTYLNEAVEEVRKAAQADADKDDRKFIFNQRWLLLKSQPEVHDKWRLDNLFELNKDLALAYQLKDQFDSIFSLEDRTEAEKQLNSYISYCRRSRLASFNKPAKRLAGWKPHLLNYFHHPITNGMVEGMNNVIKRVLSGGSDTATW